MYINFETHIFAPTLFLTYSFFPVKYDIMKVTHHRRNFDFYCTFLQIIGLMEKQEEFLLIGKNMFLSFFVSFSHFFHNMFLPPGRGGRKGKQENIHPWLNNTPLVLNPKIFSLHDTRGCAPQAKIRVLIVLFTFLVNQKKYKYILPIRG